MGSCQNHGLLLGPLNTRCRIIVRTQKGDHNFDNHPHEQPTKLLGGLAEPRYFGVIVRCPS